MTLARSYSFPSCRVFQGILAGQECLLVLTGVGKQRAQQAIAFILGKYKIDLLISSGFAGALNDKSTAGDIVVYSAVSCQSSETLSTPHILHDSAELTGRALHCAQNLKINVILGQGVTVSQVCAATRDKVQLGKDFKADAVDMESYWIAAATRKRGVPFMTIRSVSDSVDDDLSMLSRFVAKNRIQPLKTLRYFITHPAQLKTAVGYLSQFNQAGKNLALMLTRFIKTI